QAHRGGFQAAAIQPHSGGSAGGGVVDGAKQFHGRRARGKDQGFPGQAHRFPQHAQSGPAGEAAQRKSHQRRPGGGVEDGGDGVQASVSLIFHGQLQNQNGSGAADRR